MYAQHFPSPSNQQQPGSVPPGSIPNQYQNQQQALNPALFSPANINPQYHPFATAPGNQGVPFDPMAYQQVSANGIKMMPPGMAQYPMAMQAQQMAHARGQLPSQSNTVYSFVVPSQQQQKRPRRRYEEIERIYQCNWENCTKAYGTLNHLNAHVTMQKHGPKRTPEEFKEVRRVYKLKKKEEEDARKKAAADAQAAAVAAASASSVGVVPGMATSAGWAMSSGPPPPAMDRAYSNNIYIKDEQGNGYVEYYNGPQAPMNPGQQQHPNASPTGSSAVGMSHNGTNMTQTTSYGSPGLNMGMNPVGMAKTGSMDLSMGFPMVLSPSQGQQPQQAHNPSPSGSNAQSQQGATVSPSSPYASYTGYSNLMSSSASNGTNQQYPPYMYEEKR